MSAVVAIAGADAAERTRRFAFLLTTVAALYGGYLYVPASTAHYVTVAIDNHRGIYNSAWLGAMTAVLSAAFLTLAGFFLVRGSVLRDRELGTSELVTSTPVHKWTFVAGKFLSNLTVLCAIAAIMYVAAAVMQLIRGESRQLDVLAYALPFALVTIPSLSLVAAIAILFDVVRPLRGILGAVAFLFLWMALLVTPLQLSHEGRIWIPYDPLGTTVATAAMTAGAAEAYGTKGARDIVIGGGDVPKGGLTTFPFAGMHWNAALVENRLVWLVLPLVLVALAALLFDRFAGERNQQRSGARRWFDVAALVPNAAGLRLYRAELALLVNRQSIYWSLGAVAIAIAGATMPLQQAVTYVLPIATIWPVERWATLGCRERLWNVEGFLRCVPRPLVRPALAQWAAAATLGILLSAGFLFRLAAAGNWLGVLACIATLAAIAAAAFACGALTGTPRLFEGAYLIVWYLGPVNRLRELDFTNAIVTAPLVLAPVAAIVAGIALAFAFTTRATQQRLT